MSQKTIFSERRPEVPTAGNRFAKSVKKDLAGWGFIGPFMLIYLVFLVWPILQAIGLGFFKIDLLVITDRTFIGLQNYFRMFWGENMEWTLGNMWEWRIAGLLLLIPVFRGWRSKTLSTLESVVYSVSLVVIFAGVMGLAPGEGGRWNDSLFWLSFGNTVLFVLLSTPVIVGMGLLLAMALNRPGRWTGVLRTVFFAPYVLSVSVLTLIWAFLLNPQLGLIGTFLEFIGLEPISFLTSPTLAMPAIVIATLWWTVGFNVVLYLAGLQDIDKSLYEAAEIDGASFWQRFRDVTWPGLRRTTLLVMVLQIIASFQIFGQVFIMTRGGPNGATRVSIQHIYESAFRDFNLGYASAMSVFLFVVMIAFSVLQFRFSREES